MEELINKLIKEFKISPYFINCGLCDRFAEKITEKFPEAEEVSIESFRGVDTIWPGHVWVIYQGKHYDAECPLGVKDYRNLPIYKKFLA